MPDLTPDERARIHEDAEQMGYISGFRAGLRVARRSEAAGLFAAAMLGLGVGAVVGALFAALANL